MDEIIFQYIIIALFVLVLIGVYVKPLEMVEQQKQDGALQFIYTQCMNETSINLTYSTGEFYLAKENNACILRVIK